MNRYIVMIFAAALVFGCCLQAQTTNPLTTEAKRAFDNVSNNLLRAADKMPEENYTFKPVPEIRSWGELMAHTADSAASYCGRAKGEQKSVGAASKKTKAEIVAALKEALDYCDTVYDSLTDATVVQMIQGRGGQNSRLSVLNGNLSHMNEEYGYAAVYLRLKGIVPPSSDRSAGR